MKIKRRQPGIGPKILETVGVIRERGPMTTALLQRVLKMDERNYDALRQRLITAHKHGLIKQDQKGGAWRAM